MAEIAKSGEKMGWRKALLGVGFFLIIAALFVGAGMKESGGMIAKPMALAGFAMILISLLGQGVSFIKSKVGSSRHPSP